MKEYFIQWQEFPEGGDLANKIGRTGDFKCRMELELFFSMIQLVSVSSSFFRPTKTILIENCIPSTEAFRFKVVWKMLYIFFSFMNFSINKTEVRDLPKTAKGAIVLMWEFFASNSIP